MTAEQRRIVACWEWHETDPHIGHLRLVELVTAETGADVDAIVGALIADLDAKVP